MYAVIYYNSGEEGQTGRTVRTFVFENAEGYGIYSLFITSIRAGKHVPISRGVKGFDGGIVTCFLFHHSDGTVGIGLGV